MKLKAKAISILILLAVSCLACGYLIMRVTVLPRFHALERRWADADLSRARAALDAELANLEKLCRDWALWDDSYRFVQDGDRKYIDSNLVPGTFTDLRLAAIYFLDRRGATVWGEVRDGSGRRLSPPDFAGERLPFEGIADLAKGGACRCGLARSSIGPLLFCASPVTDSREERPPAGVLFMAQRLDRGTMQRINTQARAPFEVILLPPGTRGGGRRITESGGRVTVSDTVNDYLGNPLVELRASFPGEIAMAGHRTVRTLMLVSVLTALILIAFSSWILDRLVISPLETMSATAGADRGGALAAIAAGRRDEIGRLAGRLAGLEEEWERHAQDEASLSWDSGAREMAAGLLHNIRNAVNPAFSDLSLIREEMREVPTANMKQAASEIATAGRQRREMLALYLGKSVRILEGFMARLDERLQGIRSRCADIESMISAHAGAAERGTIRMSSFPLKTLVEAAVDIVPPRSRENIAIELDPSLARRVTAPRIELLQIVQNLVKNAVEAIAAVDRDGSGRIVISAAEDRGDGPGGGFLRIRVEDNGCGIDPGDIERIFRRDFTTAHAARPGAGTGLHWCANVCRGLGGGIEAESKGPGRGACFTVTVPLAPDRDEGDDDE